MDLVSLNNQTCLFISAKDKTGKYKCYNIPEDVRTYIMQLEAYILNPSESKLLEKYPERFLKKEA
jgi:23S rRNA maturation-related 3'-5' exoribonuclease YhaM